jgi:flagellar hook assembly protein FlgD
VRTILAGARYDAGAHHVDWDGRDDSGRNVASGVYFLRVQAGDRQATRKLVILR